MEETALVRAVDDREEDSEEFVVVLLRDEVEVVREGIGACVGGCEVEGSLALGAGLVAASPSSFSRALIFRERESTWKLSFLRSLSTLEIGDCQRASSKGTPPPTPGTCHRSSQFLHISPSDLPPFRRIFLAVPGGAPPN